MTTEDITPQQHDMKHQKEVEFYAASANAWFNTALEHDKSILTLSTGGIGFLITISTIKAIGSLCILIACICALISFLVSIISVLVVYKENKSIILEVLANNGETKKDSRLKLLDSVVCYSFIIGTILSAVTGSYLIYSQFTQH